MKTRQMTAALAGVALASGLSGCAVLLLGAGAAGGYAISKDSVKNTFQLPQETVFRQSLAVAKELGTVKKQDPEYGVIEMEYGPANITITVKRLTRRLVELKVRSRNQVLLPEMDRGQEVYTKILERL